MNTQDENALRIELDQSLKRLDAFAGELRAIDDELEEIEAERRSHVLLHEACGALEKLDEQEAAGLFWSGLETTATGQVHVGVVRTRIDAFQQRLGQIEGGRQGILAKIEREEENGRYVEDDLYELKRAEEERKREWIVECEMRPLPERPTIMPWTRGGEDDQRFRRALAMSLLVSLLLGVLFPWIPLPVLDRWEVIEVPDRLTRLIEKRIRPLPPVQELAPQKSEPEPLEETPLLAEQGTPEPVKSKEKPKPGAGAKGILAFREQFSSLADSAAPARLGSQARITRSGELASGRATRSLVTTDGPGSSGGIDLAALSRDVGGGGGEGIEGVQVTRATSSIGSIGGGTGRPLSGGHGSARTDEEIQIVFDRHKAALYRLYNRELRRDPTLQGQIVLRMTIQPDGSVSLCELQSSGVKAPNLAKQVVERVKTFDFGAKDGIPAITILYPIDFLPAS
ncbi:MAG: AgmX/PglI C-terminal domain-containing protein [Myxococcales bacterium]|nr:AgmX/PglI C-terminal domain-containing protein [Myxococcales bacterium]